MWRALYLNRKPRQVRAEWSAGPSESCCWEPVSSLLGWTWSSVVKACSPCVGAPSCLPCLFHGSVLPLLRNHWFFSSTSFLAAACLFDLLGNHRWSVRRSELRREIIKNETFSLSSSCKTGTRVRAPGPWRGAQAPSW